MTTIRKGRPHGGRDARPGPGAGFETAMLIAAFMAVVLVGGLITISIMALLQLAGWLEMEAGGPEGIEEAASSLRHSLDHSRIEFWRSV